MGTILALAAAVLYGSADFLGGAASRRARPLAVLAITAPAGAVVMVVAAVVASATGLGGHATAGLGGSAGLTGVAWGAAAGVVGAAGLLTFYTGFSVAPMSVVAPISALASALLPLGVAVAQGEPLSPAVIAGGVICLAAVALVSLEPKAGARSAADRLRGLGYGLASGIMFGLFFLFFRSAGTAGVLWPVAVARLVGTVVAIAACLAVRVRPAWSGTDRARAPAGARVRRGRRVRQRLLRARDAKRPVRDRGRRHRALPGDDRPPRAVRARRKDAPGSADWPGPRRGRPNSGHQVNAMSDRDGADSCGRMHQQVHPAARTPGKG